MHLIHLAAILITLFAAQAAEAKPLVRLEGERFLLDLRYNTNDNFLKKNVYNEFGLNQCFVHSDLQAKLAKLEPLLEANKLKLVLWDCWRPVSVQQAMWKIVPDSRYVANPRVGSNHNRGIAVDVTLADDEGRLLEMPTGFDDFSEKASPHYNCRPNEQQKCVHRKLLIHLMGQAGLTPLNSEWWHYQLPQALRYPMVESLDAKTP